MALRKLPGCPVRGGASKHSRQRSSTRGKQAWFAGFGVRVRYLHFLPAHRQACAYRGRAAAGRPPRRLGLKLLPILAADLMADRAGLKTQEFRWR